MNEEIQKWKGTFNWYGEVIELWTAAKTPEEAGKNFHHRLIKILDLDPNYGHAVLRSYFNGHKDNIKIERRYN